MEIKQLKSKIPDLIRKYRFVLLVLAAGIVLMSIPGTKANTKSETSDSSQAPVQNINTIEEELTTILRQIKGVGDVQLLLSLESNGETVYQTDSDHSLNEGSQNTRSETILITDDDRNQYGLERTRTAPTYRGAVVVCGGGDNPAVQLAVTQAVIASTGLSADQVCVLKMK